MIEVWCDGSSTGRSGREGGWAYVIVQDGQVLYAGYGGHPETTNNVMELLAAIEGLEALESVIDKHVRDREAVVLISDSRYTLGMATGKNQAVKNLELVTRLQAVYRRICTETRWVRGHSGSVFNERCDRLAKKGKEKARLAAMVKP